ncbi:MAG: hypothetical protein GX878_04245, partial [Firmicutes bacterium]|nr:hypothetical protein [Bacillota bacterium]
APWFLDRVEKECMRCKERNAFTRRKCRVCGTLLAGEEEVITEREKGKGYPVD